MLIVTSLSVLVSWSSPPTPSSAREDELECDIFTNRLWWSGSRTALAPAFNISTVTLAVA